MASEAIDVADRFSATGATAVARAKESVVV